MGCDIHIYRERQINGRWESVDTWSDKYGDGENVPYGEQCYEGRNYDLFGLLAKGVRREFDCSFEPRGIPLQCDPRIKAVFDGWSVDAHNHSYLYLHELRELQEFCKTHTIPVSGMKDPAELAALQASIDSGKPNWDLLYPYCAWTTRSESVKFNVDVPMDFKVGSCLATIVNSFDGIEGDNHRVVFCFDN
jgi:hypothetical protein